MKGIPRRPARKQRDAGSNGDPLAVIKHERQDQRRVCDSLELVADQLPEDVDLPLVHHTYATLNDSLPVYHRNEEALFGLMAQHAASDLPIARITEKLKIEHIAHECYADEIYDFVQSRKNGRDLGAYGYMFRCFFETIRHHLDWEDLILMPLADSVLTSADLARLSEILVRNRRTLGPSIV